jgi:membrane peptidoglycan carboxypeptidase
MATLAAGGERAPTHFVQRVVRNFASYYTEPAGRHRALPADVVADITAVLASPGNGQISDAVPWVGISGTALVPGSAIDSAHAWYVGYTPHLAMAVWVGNKEVEFPLRDVAGDRITGETLPSRIFATVVAQATEALDLDASAFGPPANLGDEGAGDAL